MNGVSIMLQGIGNRSRSLGRKSLEERLPKSSFEEYTGLNW